MEILGFIDEQMNILQVPYEFDEWTSDVQYPYFVGEMPSPETYLTEDGKTETTLIIKGFNRGKYLALEEVKEKIRKHFNPITGVRYKTDKGVIVAFYDGAYPVPTGEADLKRIEINLKIIEWKGDL